MRPLAGRQRRLASLEPAPGPGDRHPVPLRCVSPWSERRRRACGGWNWSDGGLPYEPSSCVAEDVAGGTFDGREVPSNLERTINDGDNSGAL